MPKPIFLPDAPQPRLPGLLPPNIVSSISIFPERFKTFDSIMINYFSEDSKASLNDQLAVRGLKS